VIIRGFGANNLITIGFHNPLISYWENKLAFKPTIVIKIARPLDNVYNDYPLPDIIEQMPLNNINIDYPLTNNLEIMPLYGITNDKPLSKVRRTYP
jgi:hypothetical protein